MHRASVDKRDFTTAHHHVICLVNPPNVTLQFKVKLCCSTFRRNFKAYHFVWFAKSWNKSEARLISEAVQMRAHLAAMLYVGKAIHVVDMFHVKWLGIAAKGKEASTHHPIYSPLGPLMPKIFPPQGEAVWEQLAISLSPSSTSPWLIHLGAVGWEELLRFVHFPLVYPTLRWIEILNVMFVAGDLLGWHIKHTCMICSKVGKYH